MSLRRVVSLSLMLSVFTMLVTSIILYIVPQGRVAYWSEWSLWGISKSQWGALHTNLGLFMLIAAFFHVYFNWRPMTSYMKNKARDFRLFTPNFNVALVVVAAFTALTLAELPPMVWIQDLRGTIEDNLAASLGEPPYGHAEESSLRVFLRNVALDTNRAKDNMKAAGIVVDDPTTAVIDIARANGVSPQQLYEIMLGPEDSRPSGPIPIPETMPMGSGRLSLSEFCGQYNWDVDEAVGILQAAGWQIDPAMNLKDISEANDAEALDILDILRMGFGQ